MPPTRHDITYTPQYPDLIGPELTRLYNVSPIVSSCGGFSVRETVTYKPVGWEYEGYNDNGVHTFTISEQNSIVAFIKTWIANNAPMCSNGKRKVPITVVFECNWSLSSVTMLGLKSYLQCKIVFACCQPMVTPTHR